MCPCYLPVFWPWVCCMVRSLQYPLEGVYLSKISDDLFTKLILISLQPPQLGMAIQPCTVYGLPAGNWASSKQTMSVDTAPQGYSWNVFSTGRDVRREICANMQSNLKTMVNLQYTAPFLQDLKADKLTFLVMLRWTYKKDLKTPGKIKKSTRRKSE